MSLELQKVRQQIVATQDVRKVTEALQRVAAARLVAARRALGVGERYTEALRGALAAAWEAEPGGMRPLQAPGAAGMPQALIALGTDRGLCGPHNLLVSDAVGVFRAEQAGLGPAPVLTGVGRVLQRRLRQRGWAVAHALEQPPRGGRRAWVGALAGRVLAAFRAGEVAGVSVVYPRFVSALRQEAVCERLLPVPRPGAGPAWAVRATWEPTPAAVLDGLLEESVGQALDLAVLHSLAAEDAGRQTAMSRATENAERLLGNLLQSYRQLRQGLITTEMIELATGGMR